MQIIVPFGIIFELSFVQILLSRKVSMVFLENVMMYTRYDRTQYVSFSPKIVYSRSFNLVERGTIPCSFREAFYGIFYGVQEWYDRSENMM